MRRRKKGGIYKVNKGKGGRRRSPLHDVCDPRMPKIINAQAKSESSREVEHIALA